VEHLPETVVWFPPSLICLLRKMRTQDFADWRDSCARLIAEGRYSPVTMNTDLSILRVILSTAKFELGLMVNPLEGIAPFDTSQHPMYTFEQPNSLTVDELFPALHGGFRAGSVLDKPFRAVAVEMELKKRIIPRGMRRTFQDVCRAAAVGDLVTRSISGHATEAMQRHYSTVAWRSSDAVSRTFWT
jgi:hypothetical protein